MGRQEGISRAVRALSLIIVFVISTRPCSGSFITGDVSGSGTFTFNAPGFLLIDPGRGGNFSGNIFGPAMVIKRGDGLSIFSGGSGSNYTDGTFIEGGTFLVNNPAGKPTGVGPVQVSAGATLGGSGGTRGLVTIAGGGIIAPDNGPGSIAIHGGLDLQSGSILKMELNGATPDRVLVDGGVFSADAVVVRVVSADLPLAPGRVFTIIGWSGAVGYNISADRFSLEPGVVSGYLRIPDGAQRLELVVPEPGIVACALPMVLIMLNRRKR